MGIVVKHGRPRVPEPDDGRYWYVKPGPGQDVARIADAFAAAKASMDARLDAGEPLDYWIETLAPHEDGLALWLEPCVWNWPEDADEWLDPIRATVPDIDVTIQPLTPTTVPYPHHKYDGAWVKATVWTDFEKPPKPRLSVQELAGLDWGAATAWVAEPGGLVAGIVGDGLPFYVDTRPVGNLVQRLKLPDSVRLFTPDPRGTNPFRRSISHNGGLGLVIAEAPTGDVTAIRDAYESVVRGLEIFQPTCDSSMIVVSAGDGGGWMRTAFSEGRTVDPFSPPGPAYRRWNWTEYADTHVAHGVPLGQPCPAPSGDWTSRTIGTSMTLYERTDLTPWLTGTGPHPTDVS